MNNNAIATATFTTLTNEKQPDGSYIADSSESVEVFCEVIKHTTKRSLEGSNNTEKKSIVFEIYKGLCLHPNTVVKIGNEIYGSLEVQPIVGNHIKERVMGWL